MFKFLKKFLGGKLRSLFSKPLDAATLEELEQTLYEADLGSLTAMEFTEKIARFGKQNQGASQEAFISELESYAREILEEPPKIEQPEETPPHIVMVVGVNGSGKTTSIAKLARHYQREGKKVLLATGDTFRAAAIEQLEMWSERLGCELIKAKAGADPSGVAFEAAKQAKERGFDVAIIDTAGRLHNKTDLMHELKKIARVCSPHETLLVLDSTTGQNAIDQAKTFHSFTPLTGILLAKLDGSAKGGIALAIYRELGIPIKWIGTGESAEDLASFDAEEYILSLFKE